MIWWAGIFLVGLLFYGFIPSLGAFWARRTWRDFRQRLLDSTFFPILDYRALQKPFSTDTKTSRLRYRFFGKLQAIENRGRIWLETKNFSVEVDLTGSRVFMLPSMDELQGSQPETLSWDQLSILPQQSQFFVFGTLEEEKGSRIFKQTGVVPLLVVLFDGDPRTILSRAMLHARQKNELWNSLTPLAVGAGFFVLLLMSYLLIQEAGTRLIGLVGLSLALWPLSLALPPGVGLLYFYRKFWNEARSMRGLSDLIGSSVRYFEGIAGEQAEPTTIQLASGCPYTLVSKERVKNLEGQKGLLQRGYELLKAGEPNHGYFLGCLGEEGNLKAPLDPMAEYLRFPLKPEILVVRAKKRARTGEILAVLSFALAALLNGSILLTLIIRFLT